MKTSSIVLIIVALVVVLGAAWYWLMPANTTPQAVLPSGNNSTSSTQGTSSAPMQATVTYDGSKFSPQNVTIARGGTVTFNRTAGTMNVASDEHPTHTEYDGSTRTQHCAADANPKSFDQCTPGDTYSFTFDKSGAWEYHNHANPGATGKVTVQ